MKTVEGVVRIGSDPVIENEESPSPERGDFSSLDEFLSFLEAVGEGRDVTIQAFDARYVAGEEHLSAAVEHARRAMDRGTNVADDLAVEILCYAAGRRQIDQAMKMGLSEGEHEVVVVLDGPDAAAASVEIQERVEHADPASDETVLRSFFGVSDRELAATDADLETLVVERVALLDVEK